MALTPNYSFIIPTGTDAVNLLTQCYPNFSSLDTLLKPIQESGVTVATDTKVGTVHQLVRTDSSCNMFRFTATGNYASGDTFTVDGASVTATAVDGTALPGGAFVINQSVVAVINGSVLTVMVPGTFTLPTINANVVVYDNTLSGLTATNVQAAVDELQTEISNIPTAQHGMYELWKNPDSTNAFAAQDIAVGNDYDTYVIESVDSGNRSICVTYVEKNKTAIAWEFIARTNGSIRYLNRPIASSTGKLSFSDATKRDMLNLDMGYDSCYICRHHLQVKQHP